MPLLGLLPPGGRHHKHGALLLRPRPPGVPLQQPSPRGVPPHLPRLFGKQLHRLHLRGKHDLPRPKRGVRQDGNSPASVHPHGRRRAGRGEPGPNESAAASGDVHAADVWMSEGSSGVHAACGTPTSHILVCLAIHPFPLLQNNSKLQRVTVTSREEVFNLGRRMCRRGQAVAFTPRA